MKYTKQLIALGATASLVASLAVASPVFAWHPEGTIIKKVQNLTTVGVLADANDESSAVSVKPGDIIRYVVEVGNAGASNSQNQNDMVNTTLSDTLPAGVELASNPSLRTINENLGTIKPGAKVTKEYQLKVTSTKDGEVITNTACFSGNSEVNDSSQRGCDKAVIKVKIPPVPPVTPPAPTPTLPAVQATSITELPNTGAGSNVAVLAFGSAVLGYIGRLAYARRNS